MSDVTTDSSKKIRNILRTASTTSTDSGVIGQEESHDSQQSSPSSTLTLSQRLSWPEFRHQAGNQTHISASCSDLTKTEVNCLYIKLNGYSITFCDHFLLREANSCLLSKMLKCYPNGKYYLQKEFAYRVANSLQKC